jgi:peptide deformylase
MEIVVPDAYRHLFDQESHAPVVKIPAEVLRQTAKPIERVTNRHKFLAENMVKIMRQARGIGIAAPQVGVSERLIVVQPDSQPIILYNPEILEMEGSQIGEEGCLSIPGLYGDVERAAWLKVKGLDRKGRESTWEMEGMAARVVLHEVDHLDGVLFTDKVDAATLHWRLPDEEDE